MNIIIATPNFTTSGSQFVVLSLYKHLKQKQIDVRILIGDKNGFFPEEVFPADRRVLPKRKSTSKLDGLNYVASLTKFLRKENVDVFHSWDYRWEPWEAIACRLTGVKYLYTKKNRAWSRRWKIKSYLAHAIAYDNPAMLKDFFSEESFSKKAIFIPHGIDLSRFEYRQKKTDGRMFTIGCVGVIGENKNQLSVLRALARLESKFNAVFYGKEDLVYRSEVNKYISENNLENQVSFPGTVENNKIPDVMSGFDVLVLPSYKEGFGVVLLEAMAVGTYCVASRSGGGPEFILNEGEFGSLFTPDNDSELAEIIKELANSPERMESVLPKARKRVEQLFQDTMEAECYVKMYQSLIGK